MSQAVSSPTLRLQVAGWMLVSGACASSAGEAGQGPHITCFSC